MTVDCVPAAGDDFYGMYDAQNFAQQHAGELGMQTVPSLDVVFTEEQGYVTADVVRVLFSLSFQSLILQSCRLCCCLGVPVA